MMKGLQEGTLCPACGQQNQCGVAAGAADCWCRQLPQLSSADASAVACYCPVCLRALLATAPQHGSEQSEHTSAGTAP